MVTTLRIGRLTCGLFTMGLFCALGSGEPTADRVAAAGEGRPQADANPPAPPSRGQAPPLILEEKPEWLAPSRARTEADLDHIEALARFSAARIRENRQDYLGALRLYQRAFRCDPKSAVIVRAIVPLAVRLNRHSEAVRYALKLVEIEEADPQLLKRLAVYLAEVGDFRKALTLFEKALADAKNAKPSAADVALRMEIGRLSFLTGQYAKAAAQFQQVLDALEHPDRFGLDAATRKAILAEPGPTYAMIGESFLRAGQPDQALVVFEKGQKVAPNKGLFGFQAAKVALKKGKPEQALGHLQAYFDARLSVEEAAPYRLLADALAAVKKSEELVGRLEKLRAADPDNPYLGYDLAEKHFEAQRFDQAEKIYRELVAKKPAVIAYRNLVQICRKAGRYDDLLKVLSDAVGKLESLDPIASKGHPLGDDGELVRGVVQSARRQLKADPKSLTFEARLAVALLAEEAQQWDTAGEFYDLAIQAKRDQAARLLLSWGFALLLKDQQARAVKVFQRGIDEKTLPADDPTFLFYVAGALEMTGQTEPALVAARKALDLAEKQASSPKPPDKKQRGRDAKEELPRYQSRVAWILYHAKRYEEATKSYREIVERYGKDYSSGEIRKAVREARLVLSNLAVLKNDLPAAEEWLEQVLDEFPDDVSAQNDLGYLWADQAKHLDRAHGMIRNAVEKEPDNAAYRDSLGWVLFRKGKISEALAELEKAARAEPDPTVLEHLGDAYRAAGQPEKAKQSWGKAVEAYRKSHEDQKANNTQQKIKSLP